nr:hypothetical protein [Adlercreutzia sp. ZJ154]
MKRIVARLLDFDNLPHTIYIQQSSYVVQVASPLNNLILNLLVGEPFHAPRIENNVTRLMNGLAQALLNNAKIVRRWSLHFPKHAVG